MNQRMTRRRFGQLVIGGSTAVGLGYLAKNTFAQTPNLILLGVRSGRITADNTAIPEINSSEVDYIAEYINTASIPVGLVMQSLDIKTGLVVNLPCPQLLADGCTSIISSNEEVSNLTALADGTLVLAITPVIGSKNETEPTRLIVLGDSAQVVPLSGLQKQEKLESFVATHDGRLLGMVMRKNGRPPARLVDINLQTGKITANSRVELPSDQRFITLTQCPDGTFYTTNVANDGSSNLVQLDLEQKKSLMLAKLSLKSGVLNNGLQSLVCSPGGQLLAFGASRYETINNLYTVNAHTGAVSLLKQFDVTKVVLARA